MYTLNDYNNKVYVFLAVEHYCNAKSRPTLFNIANVTIFHIKLCYALSNPVTNINNILITSINYSA